MNESQLAGLVRRLVEDPHDTQAISEAHSAGQADPEGYAKLLERVGHGTPDRALSCRWLTEAARVWSTTFEDSERAIKVLLSAVERDPTSDAVADSLTALYEAAGDPKSIAVLVERRATGVMKLADAEPELRALAASLFEELGRLQSEQPISNRAAAKQSFLKAIELAPDSPFAIYSVRELHKAAGEYAQALPYFAIEQALVTSDDGRKVALYADEADVAKQAQKPERAIQALKNARRFAPEDPSLKQQLGSLILERVRTGKTTTSTEKRDAASLFVSLAEEYPGEHGFLYALCGLELSPDDRAMQLAIYYGEPLARLDEVSELAAGYLAGNPDGAFAAEARRLTGEALVAAPEATGQAPLPSAAPPPEPRAEGDRQAVAGTAPELSVDAEELASHAAAPAQAATGPAPSAQAPAVAPLSVETSIALEDLLSRAAQLAEKHRRNEALLLYLQVLDADPVHPEALDYLQKQLPSKRRYADLRDVLLQAIAAPNAEDADRIVWLGEVATLSETQLRDPDGAIAAWRQVLELDSTRGDAREELKRLLERARQWEELAGVLQTEAELCGDLEARIATEEKIADIHASRRKDPVGAGQAWARITELSPGDEHALGEAVKWFEKGERTDLAAALLSQSAQFVQDVSAKRQMFAKLGELQLTSGNIPAAAQALADGARAGSDAAMWGRAEALFAQAERWADAAAAACEHAELLSEEGPRAERLAAAGFYFTQAGALEEALSRLQEAVELAPRVAEYAEALEARLTADGELQALTEQLLSRALAIEDPALRLTLRRRAAIVQRDQLENLDETRAIFQLVVEDHDDPESLVWLASDAWERQEMTLAAGYLSRLANALPLTEEKVDVLLREAALQKSELHDLDTAIERYEAVISLDAHNAIAWSQIVEIELGRGNFQIAADRMNRQLQATADLEVKLGIAFPLADLYEHQLNSSDDAMRVLELIHRADPDDFDATQRLCRLAEAGEHWALFAELMVELIAVEGDEDELSAMSRRLAEALHQKLDNGREALNVLGAAADSGDTECREAFVQLGDELGEKLVVARRLLAWYAKAPPGPARAAAMRGAFDRLVESGDERAACGVAKDMARVRATTTDMGESIEVLAVRLGDQDALSIAHELLVRELGGIDRAHEAVRQAEVRLSTGAPPLEAISRGERGLSLVSPEDVEPLLARLAALSPDPALQIGVYERQIHRCKSADDRLRAVCRAAEFAAQLGDLGRAQGFFQAALSANSTQDMLERVLEVARRIDEEKGEKKLRQLLAESLVSGGESPSDGGRTRTRLLSFAARLAQAELGDVERAFRWVGEALRHSVDEETLDLLE
ncbi:MAG: hypothetical protein RJA70_3992, partial [Pseudomonadota bacterium]